MGQSPADWTWATRPGKINASRVGTGAPRGQQFSVGWTSWAVGRQGLGFTAGSKTPSVNQTTFQGGVTRVLMNFDFSTWAGGGPDLMGAKIPTPTRAGSRQRKSMVGESATEKEINFQTNQEDTENVYESEGPASPTGAPRTISGSS